MERDVRRDPYKVLQVDPEADPEVIQAAYRRLAQKHHPDVSTDPESPARMAEINAAWELLRDPERRADLDRRRASGSGTVPAPAPPVRQPPARTPGSSTDRSTQGLSGVAGPSGPGEPTVGPPPGDPSGSVLTFGRYAGWSLGDIARTDLDYLEWLDRMAIGRQYRDEIDAILRRAGRRRSAATEAEARHGLFRRR